MKKSAGAAGHLLLCLFFLLSLASCGMGGGGTGGSAPPSSTFSALGVKSFGAIAVDKATNNVWVAYGTSSGGGGLMEIPSTATSCATTTDCPLISLGFTPAGIAVDSLGNIWVTNDTTSGSVTEIPVSIASHFTGTTSCPSSSCPTFTGFSSPTGIAGDSNKNIWVTNTSSNSVTEIPSGAASCSSCKTFSGDFSSPTGIAVDSNNNVWVTNDSSSSGSVTKISSTAAISGTCSPTYCPTFLGFSNPVAVATTGTTPWVANSGSGGSYPQAVVEINNSCTSSVCPQITHFTQPVGLAFDPSGNLWVIDAGNTTTVEITASAISSTGCATSSPCYQYSLPSVPAGIATDSSGHVWISLQKAQVIEYKP